MEISISAYSNVSKNICFEKIRSVQVKSDAAEKPSD